MKLSESERGVPRRRQPLGEGAGYSAINGCGRHFEPNFEADLGLQVSIYRNNRAWLLASMRYGTPMKPQQRQASGLPWRVASYGSGRESTQSLGGIILHTIDLSQADRIDIEDGRGEHCSR